MPKMHRGALSHEQGPKCIYLLLLIKVNNVNCILKRMARVACKQCLVSTFETPWATPNFIDKIGNGQIYVISSSN